MFPALASTTGCSPSLPKGVYSATIPLMAFRGLPTSTFYMRSVTWSSRQIDVPLTIGSQGVLSANGRSSAMSRG